MSALWGSNQEAGLKNRLTTTMVLACWRTSSSRLPFVRLQRRRTQISPLVLAMLFSKRWIPAEQGRWDNQQAGRMPKPLGSQADAVIFTVWQWVGAAMIAIAAVLPAGSKTQDCARLAAIEAACLRVVGCPLELISTAAGHAMIAWFDAHDGDVRPEVNAIMRKAVDLNSRRRSSPQRDACSSSSAVCCCCSAAMAIRLRPNPIDAEGCILAVAESGESSELDAINSTRWVVAVTASRSLPERGGCWTTTRTCRLKMDGSGRQCPASDPVTVADRQRRGRETTRGRCRDRIGASLTGECGLMPCRIGQDASEDRQSRDVPCRRRVGCRQDTSRGPKDWQGFGESFSVHTAVQWQDRIQERESQGHESGHQSRSLQSKSLDQNG